MFTTTSGVKGGHCTEFIYTVPHGHISSQLIIGRFIKLTQKWEIPLQQVNSAARLKISWPTEIWALTIIIFLSRLEIQWH